ncbi:MAG: hypothetical protein IH830_01925 [Planctomycetes bacterium]|nr:hypothetical protein [Planctomycetota bacterium]
MIAAAARIEEAVEHVRARNKARRDANTIGDSADGSSDCGGKVVSAADKAHSALTNLYEATMSLGDALFDYKNDGLASVSPVYAAIEQWYEAKDAASQQILRAAHRIDDSLAEGPQPTTVLLNELDQLGRECEILQTKAATPTYLWAPGPERMRALLMVYGIGFFKGLVDQVITMRRQWDKLTGLLDRPGQGHVRSAGSAAEENLPGAASHPAMTRQEANIKARELLKVDATFADKSQRDWASEIGCSVGLVFNLPMRRAVMEQRSKLRKPKVRKPNVVALTHKLEATIGKPDKALEHLLSEHQDDQEPSPLDHDDPCSKPQRVKARRQV